MHPLHSSTTSLAGSSGSEPVVGGEPVVAGQSAGDAPGVIEPIQIPLWYPEYSLDDIAAFRKSREWGSLTSWVKWNLAVTPRQVLSAHTMVHTIVAHARYTACQPKKVTWPSVSSLKACGVGWSFLQAKGLVVAGQPAVQPAVGGNI